MGNEVFGQKIWKERKIILSLQPEIVFIMSNSRTITIKNPSRKLEERIRKIGVQKYLWIEQLCSDKNKPTKTIHV